MHSRRLNNLGKGGFSDVILEKHKGQLYACKQVRFLIPRLSSQSNNPSVIFLISLMLCAAFTIQILLAFSDFAFIPSPLSISIYNISKAKLLTNHTHKPMRKYYFIGFSKSALPSFI